MSTAKAYPTLINAHPGTDDLARQESAIRQRFYSVVIPVYNSAKILPHTLERTKGALDKFGLDYEIIAVNDGSIDDSWTVLCEQARLNRRLVAINLIKNYGQQAAVFCGLSNSRGDYVITLDDDLQNPPEEIIHLIRKAIEGYDLVCGRFIKKRHALHRTWGSIVINKMNEKIFAKPKDFSLTNFRIMDRRLVQQICSYRVAFPYVSGLAVMLSGKIANVSVEHCARSEGKSGYTIKRLLELVATILFNYSSYPLRTVCLLGLSVSLGSFAFGAYEAFKKLAFHCEVPGWTSLIVLLSFFNGVVTLILGILGEYIIRLMNTTSSQPCFHVREVVRSDEEVNVAGQRF